MIHKSKISRIEDDRDEESFDSDSDLEDREKELLSKVRSRRGALSDSEVSQIERSFQRLSY